MADTRHKDVNWTIRTNADGTVPWDGCKLAVLMDIRDELKRINSVLHCSNFLTLPFKVERIARNTSKPRKRRKKVPNGT